MRRKRSSSSAKVLTLSDPGGFIHDPGTGSRRTRRLEQKTSRTSIGRSKAFQGASFTAGKTPWGVPATSRCPAPQNELLGDDARTLVANGCIAVSEGANMPTDLDGVQ